MKHWGCLGWILKIEKNSMDVLDLHFLVKTDFSRQLRLEQPFRACLKLKAVEFHIDVLLSNLPNARVHILDPVNPQPSRATPL